MPVRPGYLNKGVIISSTNPLESGEDRLHSHGYALPISVADVTYAGVDGCCNNELTAAGKYTVLGNVSESVHLSGCMFAVFVVVVVANVVLDRIHRIPPFFVCVCFGFVFHSASALS